MKNNTALFLTLKVFSATGGIEKVCRVVGKTLFEYGMEKNEAVAVYAMHGDKTAVDGNRYLPSEIFRSFVGGDIFFMTHPITSRLIWLMITTLLL